MTAPIGKYKLVRLIASGGMAEVYLARQAGAAGFEKLVCLKRILPHLARDKQFVEMFLNEARLAARLDHPNIVSIFDLGEANGTYFIAMAFSDGPSLRAAPKRALERRERPWVGDSKVSLIGRIMTEDPPPLSTLRPDAPAGLVAVLDRALAKDREARCASCHDLQADLEALLVSMGQTITQARISDFAKSYADPIAVPDESTGAAMQALEAEMNGTGAVRPVPGRRVPGQPREPRTVVLPAPPPP